MRVLGLICAVLMAAGPGLAQDRETLGTGRLFTNDFIGDGGDRWRTGGYSYSIVRGEDWQGRVPSTPGAILEYRLRSEIIAPGRLNGAGSDDRTYVGALSAGLHTHFARGNTDVSLGVDVVAIGPQTGLSGLQDWYHDLVSAPSVGPTVIANQAPNAVHLTARGEAAYPAMVSDSTIIRPFVALQYGIEDIARVGVDILIGQHLHNDLWLRDPTTGQLYSGIEGGGSGTGFALGIDYAMVGDSAYFPSSFGTTAQEERLRARAGVHLRLGRGMSYFCGLTYLSEEYAGQPEGQIVGSLKLNFNF